MTSAQGTNSHGGREAGGPRHRPVRVFFRVALPAVWLAAALVSWRHPGDEYLMFTLVNGLPGAWLPLLLGPVGPPQALPLLLAAGGATVALAGWGMDRLRVWRGAWAVLFAAGVVGWTLAALSGYESYAGAVAKNGSLAAYVSAATNLSLYAATFVCACGALAGRCGIRVDSRPGSAGAPP